MRSGARTPPKGPRPQPTLHQSAGLGSFQQAGIAKHILEHWGLPINALRVINRKLKEGSRKRPLSSNCKDASPTVKIRRAGGRPQELWSAAGLGLGKQLDKVGSFLTPPATNLQGHDHEAASPCTKELVVLGFLAFASDR